MRMGSAAASYRAAGLLLMSMAIAPVAFSASAGNHPRLAGEYGKLPLSFEENRGQTDARVKYISRGSGYALFLTPSETLLSLTGVDGRKNRVATSVRMSFVGGREAKVSALEPQANRSSYFIGSDKNQWRTGVRNFGKVSYKGIYEGIDAVFYGNQRQMEYDFVVAPGADPDRIRLKFDGTKSIATSPNGDLVLSTELGDLRQLRPVVYQQVAGQRRTVEARYRVKGNEASFEIGAYDARLPLIIDPVLAWSTFIAGSGSDTVAGLAVDGSSNVILAGFTSSSDFSAANRFVGIARGGVDAFISKLSPTGTVAWSVYYGGQRTDEALGVATDAEGSVYITGRTDSQELPLVNPLQNAPGSTAFDAFVAKISGDGTTLIYSTYLGGQQNDEGWDIAVDPNGRASVVGTTLSTNFWATHNQLVSRGLAEGFATKLNASGGGLVWSTYLGGHEEERAFGVAVDATGATYVTGSTSSYSFQSTSGVVQPVLGSTNLGNGKFAADAFAVKMSNEGVLVYSTYLGGAGFDEGISIAVDADGNAYIVGNTESGNYPVINALQATNNGNRDAFVTKLNANATARVYSTYLGGTGIENAYDIAVRNGAAFVTGSTTSTNFPLAGPTQLANAGANDVFVTQLTPAGTALASSTYIGGAFDDTGYAIGLDTSGNIYVAGATTSTNYPVAGAIQPLFAGIQDGFVTKLSNCTVTLSPTLNGAPGFAHSNAAQAGIITVTGSSDCTWSPTSNATWLSIVSATATAGNGQLSYIITQNSNAPRTGIISIAGVSYTVQQAGGVPAYGCMYAVDPNSIIAPASGVTGSFLLGTANASCPWTARSNAPWLQMFPGSGTNTTTVSYTVYPNFSLRVRTAQITITSGSASQTFTVTQANPFLTEPQRFVTLLYSNYFGRYPTQAEIDFQVSVLNGGASRGTLAANFFAAAEFLQGGRFVAGLYLGLLGRDPEFGGWLFQRNALATGVASQEQLVQNFLNSQEFALKGITTNEQFVTTLYVQILGRQPIASELAFHAGLLNAGGITRVQTATNFLNSLEFRVRLDARMSAFLLYATLLQRDPSITELVERTVQLQAGTGIAAIADNFIFSPEFQLQLQ